MSFNDWLYFFDKDRFTVHFTNDLNVHAHRQRVPPANTMTPNTSVICVLTEVGGELHQLGVILHMLNHSKNKGF